jgi:hypothetical protein
MDKPKKQNQHSSGIIHAQQTTIYRGHLPPPEMLEKLNLFNLVLQTGCLKWWKMKVYLKESKIDTCSSLLNYHLF